jgi:hypothetical protein
MVIRTADVEPPVPPAKVKAVNRRARKEKPPVVDDSQQVVWPPADMVVESSLLPEAAAWEDAMAKARNLMTHDLHLARVPSEEFIRRHVLKDWKTVEGPSVEGTSTMRVKLDLELTRETWRELAQAEREVRSQHRMDALARLVAVVTAVLGAVAGYVRLDEWTKGYYTGRLRLAAVALAIVAALAVIA